MSHNIPGLWTPTVDGKKYAYYRPNRHAKPIRITAADGSHPLPGAADFMEAFERFAQADAPPAAKVPPARSLSALIAAYKSDQHWHDLSARTRYNYAQVFRWLEPAFGAAQVPALDRVRVLAVRKHFAGSGPDGKPLTPAKANQVIKVLGILVRHAINIGWRHDNPCADPQRLREGPGIRTWTAEDFEAFIACDKIGEAIKRAAVLALFTGLRISDLVRLPRSARQDGVISVATQKTGAVAWVPEHPDLTRWLDAAPPRTAPTLLTTERGHPWTATNLQRQMRNSAKLAGLPALSMHGLRKALTARLAEAGASDAEIGATVPHSAQMTAYYRAAAQQRVLAASAMARLGVIRTPVISAPDP